MLQMASIVAATKRRQLTTQNPTADPQCCGSSSQTNLDSPTEHSSVYNRPANTIVVWLPCPCPVMSVQSVMENSNRVRKVSTTKVMKKSKSHGARRQTPHLVWQQVSISSTPKSVVSSACPFLDDRAGLTMAVVSMQRNFVVPSQAHSWVPSWIIKDVFQL